MTDRYADLLKQGFMKPLKVQAAKTTKFDEAAWKARNVAAAKARYASYGPSFFQD